MPRFSKEAELVMRADARRNRERLVAVAGEVVAEQGFDASLEEIARRAGVGSATLHRHFRSRQELLDAVFRERVEGLCARGEELLVASDSRAALVAWLHAVVAHAAAHRGMSPTISAGTDAHAVILAAGEALLVRAQRDGAVRADVPIGDLFGLVSAIASVAEAEPEQARRLLDLALEGVKS